MSSHSQSHWTHPPEGQRWTLEFVGGPLDGYTYAASFPFSELVSTMAMPINQNIVRMLGGEHEGPKKPATSVAIYELTQRDGTWRYEYIGAASTAQFQLEAWVG